MPDTTSRIQEEAIGWVIRLRNASGREWEEFTLWLEADPRHLQAYEDAALADQDFERLPAGAPASVMVPESEREPRSAGRRAFLGWAVAAALVATIGYVSVRPGESRYAVETGAGERRSVALADGSRIDLNGSTRIVLDRDEVRFARLETGEALFTIVHDDSAPFEVEAGDALIKDMGTIFNVVHAEGAVEIGVAEGEVLFNPEEEAVRLTPGMTLYKREGQFWVLRGEPASVGGWREGRLSYSSASAGRVAADLSRNLGVAVGASPEVARKRFSGVIVLDRDPERLFRRVSALLDVEARRAGDGWMLTETGGTP